jgi:hypothetical protein
MGNDVQKVIREVDRIGSQIGISVGPSKCCGPAAFGSTQPFQGRLPTTAQPRRKVTQMQVPWSLQAHLCVYV